MRGGWLVELARKYSVTSPSFRSVRTYHAPLQFTLPRFLILLVFPESGNHTFALVKLDPGASTRMVQHCFDGLDCSASGSLYSN